MMAAQQMSGSDMVIGVRVNRNDTWSRKMQSRIGNGVRNWITKDKITDTGCSLKLIRREAIDKVQLYTGMHRFLPTLVRMAGYKVIEMPVNHRARKYGVSKYGAMNRAFRGLVDCMAVRWMGKRMLKYKDKLFTFLDHDGVPWNNNNAEVAIKRFASRRKLMGASFTAKGIQDYLVFLSIYQTCRNKNVSFLRFLRSGSLDLDTFVGGRRS